MTTQAATQTATQTLTQTATLGGGCFWCLEAVYQSVQGVHEVTSGYSGGFVSEPTYRQVCSGTTGHAEVVQVRFDPNEVSYADLLRIFFAIHDPTTRDRQGADVGPQYRSIILTHGPEQEATAHEVIEELTRAAIWPAPIVTEVSEFERFWMAEPEHHRYFERYPRMPYCQAVVAPKVAKFRSGFAHLMKSP